MEQGGRIKNPGLVPTTGQLGAQGVFVGVLCHEKTAHIAQHHQDMLVHCIGMEQVVLHLTHDAPENPEVASQYRGVVHQPQCVGDALRLLQDFQKSLSIDRVGPKLPVHHRAYVVKRSQRSRRETLEAWRGLVEQESLQNGVWLFLVQVVAGDFDQAGFLEKTLIQWAEMANAFAPFGFESVFDVEQQDLVELRDGFGRPIVLAHQLFTGSQRQATFGGHVRAEAKSLGHTGLQVKDQSVFTPLGLQVQARTDQPQQGLIALDLPRFQRRGQSLASQFIPAVTQSSRACHPQNHLQISQATRGLLAIRLQGIWRVFKLGVALAHFQCFGHQEGLRVHRFLKFLLKLGKQTRVACDPTRLEQGGLNRDVFGRFGQALMECSNAGADVEPRVPAAANEAFKLRLQIRGVLRGLAIWQQHQHVDIRVREQLGTAKTSHRHQTQFRRKPGVVPKLYQQTIGQNGQLPQGLLEAPGHRAAARQRRQHGGFVVLVGLAQRGHVGQRGWGVHVRPWLCRTQTGVPRAILPRR